LVEAFPEHKLAQRRRQAICAVVEVEAEGEENDFLWEGVDGLVKRVSEYDVS